MEGSYGFAGGGPLLVVLKSGYRLGIFSASLRETQGLMLPYHRRAWFNGKDFKIESMADATTSRRESILLSVKGIVGDRGNCAWLKYVSFVAEVKKEAAILARKPDHGLMSMPFAGLRAADCPDGERILQEALQEAEQ
jgi:hypothetical protein